MQNDDCPQKPGGCGKGTMPGKDYKHLKQKQKLKIAGRMFESTCSYYREHGRMPAGDACGKLAGEIHRKINNFVPGIPYEEVYRQYLRKLPQHEKRIAGNGLPEKNAEKEKAVDGDERRNRKEKTAGKNKKKKGRSNKRCPACGRKMKQQFTGLQHCRCGMSWKKGSGYFERDSGMVFALERRKAGKKLKQRPVIRRGDN